MQGTPLFSEAEWALVVELLERERYELPSEIHHTRTSTFRDQLRERLALVESLLARLLRSDEKCTPR